MSRASVGLMLTISLAMLATIDETSPVVGALALICVGGLIVLIAQAANDWLETRRPR